ncbi:MAG: DUF6544 family protein [Pseudohongiellaceae bacterium]
MTTLATIIILIILTGAALWIWRRQDHKADEAARQWLRATQPTEPARFDPAMVSALPEPARRYFQFAILPGTPLYTVADISMSGQFGLGTRARPNYMSMQAGQTLALPTGFVWKMGARKGLMSLSGSDSDSWTRFWLSGLLPVARRGGDSDHARSAFGRYAAEAVFWTPAALLPGPGIHWEAVDLNTTRVVIRHKGMVQPVDVTVAADGSPLVVSFPRWSNANPDKVHRIQPFGGYLSAYREFSGFRLPTHVEAGNFFGTGDYFPFFIIDVSAISFP